MDKIQSDVESYGKKSNDMSDVIFKVGRLYETAEYKLARTKIKSEKRRTPNDNNASNTKEKQTGNKDNFNSLNYRGEEYPIYVPEDNGPTIQSAERWKNVYENSVVDFDFDMQKAIMGFSLEETNSYVFPGNRSNADKLVATHALLGIFGGITSGTSTTSIGIYLQEKPTAGSRRAIIGVRNSQMADKIEKFDYSKPFSSYEYLKENGDKAAQTKMNIATAEFYEDVTGKKSNTVKYRYDVQVTLDERHQNNRYQSYISIDKDGNYVKTNISYPKDEVRIVVRDIFGRETGESYVIDTNGSSSEVIDSETSDMLREVLNIK